jgi:(p)ppGpp synthase/HD superfamily hydrolase
MDLVDRARGLAGRAYSPKDLEHALEVTDLVASTGASDEVVAAALLHDLIEDTGIGEEEIAAEFGSQVAALVSTLTEDASIRDYKTRKKEHRDRVAAAGRDAALIFVADKLSNARRMRRGVKKPAARKLAHYAATLELMRERYPDLPLLGDLEQELRAVRADLQRSPA